MWAFALIVLVCAVQVCSAVAVDASVDASSSQQQEDKRAAHDYNFGLGKRSNFGSDLRRLLMLYPQEFVELFQAQNPLYEPSRNREFRYLLGSIKRSKPARFNFGLGKRSEDSAADNDEMIVDEDANNGAEKRAAGRYQFGIGKRAVLSAASSNEFDDYMKRRYSFGLGRR